MKIYGKNKIKINKTIKLKSKMIIIVYVNFCISAITGIKSYIDLLILFLQAHHLF